MFLEIKDPEEYKTVLNALNHYGQECMNLWTGMGQKLARKPDGGRFTREEMQQVKRRADMCFKMQVRLQKENDKKGDK